jgi:hypothetical protein
LGINVEITLRGFLEKEIDSLTPEVLGKVLVFEKFFPMKSLEDFLLGFIVGMMSMRMAMTIQIGYNRQPNDAEMGELFELIERRTTEIKGKIKLAMSK